MKHKIEFYDPKTEIYHTFIINIQSEKDFYTYVKLINDIKENAILLKDRPFLD